VRVPAAVAAAAMTAKVLARVSPDLTQLRLSARTMTNPWLRSLPGLTPKAAAVIAQARESVDGAGGAAAGVARQTGETTPPVSVPAAKVADIGPPAAVAAAPLAAAKPPVTAAPAHNTTGGLSMARQLGLGVSRIVIDPG